MRHGRTAVLRSSDDDTRTVGSAVPRRNDSGRSGFFSDEQRSRFFRLSSVHGMMLSLRVRQTSAVRERQAY